MNEIRNIEILLRHDGKAGIICEHGQLWKNSEAELIRHLNFVFDRYRITGKALVADRAAAQERYERQQTK